MNEFKPEVSADGWPDAKEERNNGVCDRDELLDWLVQEQMWRVIGEPFMA